jgi:hypothetical protein
VFADPDRVPRPACAPTGIHPDRLAPTGIHSVFLAPTGMCLLLQTSVVTHDMAGQVFAAGTERPDRLAPTGIHSVFLAPTGIWLEVLAPMGIDRDRHLPRQRQAPGRKAPAVDAPPNGLRQPRADRLARRFPSRKAMERILARKIAASQASRLHAVLGGASQAGAYPIVRINAQLQKTSAL